jgi:small subunit ribosomal protein S18
MFNDPRRNIRDIVNQVNEMDNDALTYKNVEILSNFLNEQGKILPRRTTGLNSKQQKKITKLIKQARVATLLPFILSR